MRTNPRASSTPGVAPTLVTLPERRVIVPTAATPPRRPGLTERAPKRLDMAIDASTQARFEELFADVVRDLPGAPPRIVDETTHSVTQAQAEHVLWKESYAGRPYSYTFFNVPEVQAAELQARLGKLVAGSDLPLRILWGGVVALIADGAGKGRALHDFSRRHGLRLDDIVKFGDSAGVGGNDVELLVGAHSYNVGEGPAANANVVNVASQAGLGVGEVLRTLTADGQRPKAVASDVDGTLVTWKTNDFVPETMVHLAELLETGMPLAIVTGRGGDAIPLVREALKKGGAGPKSLDRVSYYLFHGALRA